MADPWQQQAAEKLARTIKKLHGEPHFHLFSLIELSNLWLVACFQYYMKDDPILEDHLFDQLSNYLHQNRDQMKEAGVWWVDKLFPADALEAGTGYHMHGSYPFAIEEIAGHMKEAMK